MLPGFRAIRKSCCPSHLRQAVFIHLFTFLPRDEEMVAPVFPFPEMRMVEVRPRAEISPGQCVTVAFGRFRIFAPRRGRDPCGEDINAQSQKAQARFQPLQPELMMLS
jgi:hypothetical protein